jgi:hypothetical protein
MKQRQGLKNSIPRHHVFPPGSAVVFLQCRGCRNLVNDHPEVARETRIGLDELARPPLENVVIDGPDLK